MKITPALIARNKKELLSRFTKVKSLSKTIHIDIMDGQFVKTRSNMFDWELPKTHTYLAHLMVQDPLRWCTKNLHKVQSVSIHTESKHVEETIRYVRKQKKRIGLALNPSTPLSKLSPYISKVDFFMLMTVYPGTYGAQFVPSVLGKIKRLKKMTRKPIGVDGAITDRTISRVRKAGADKVSVGSYLMFADNPEDAMKRLQKNA